MGLGLFEFQSERKCSVRPNLGLDVRLMMSAN